MLNDENSSKTVKIIQNINNIIINDNNNNNKNEMIININSNIYHFKNTKNKPQSIEKINFKIKDKIKKIDLNNKRNTLNKEKRIYTTFNTLSNNKKNKIKPIFNHILSPKINNNKKNSINKNNNLQKKIYRNDLITSNIFKNNNKLSEYKTLSINNSDINKNNNNKFCNKLKITKNRKSINKFRIKLNTEIKDKTKTSINRKIINNYLKTNKKKRIYKRPFNTYENTSINNLSNHNKNNEVFNSIQDKTKHYTITNNSNKIKINKKKIIHKSKTNSMQINNKNYLLSSLNLTKEKIPLEIKIKINKKNNEKYPEIAPIFPKPKIILYSKTQSNSDTETKNISKESNHIKSRKSLNIDVNCNKIKKIRIKDKYHKFKRDNKNIHGSYDYHDKLNMFIKYKSLNNANWSITNSINNIKKKKNKSPLNKKYIIHPDVKIKGIINNYTKTSSKSKQNINNQKISKIENIFIKNKKKQKNKIKININV